MMKLIQIEHSGSTQTSYWPTAIQSDVTLEILAAEGQLIERPDIVECVSPNVGRVDRVIQVKSGGEYAGTTGRFFAVQKPDYSEYTTTVHSAPENFGDCTDEQAEKIVEKLKKMISEQFPGIQIRINPCYGGCGSMADATHNGDGDTDDTCNEIDRWISENWEKALDI